MFAAPLSTSGKRPAWGKWRVAGDGEGRTGNARIRDGVATGATRVAVLLRRTNPIVGVALVAALVAGQHAATESFQSNATRRGDARVAGGDGVGATSE
ncbi:MAG: hypothetical protein N3C12_00735 [Candidatus Binatia bacterium]|nr:hypothetical protein [Candidatus Binatia bacterium]